MDPPVERQRHAARPRRGRQRQPLPAPIQSDAASGWRQPPAARHPVPRGRAETRRSACVAVLSPRRARMSRRGIASGSRAPARPAARTAVCELRLRLNAAPIAGRTCTVERSGTRRVTVKLDARRGGRSPASCSTARDRSPRSPPCDRHQTRTSIRLLAPGLRRHGEDPADRGTRSAPSQALVVALLALAAPCWFAPAARGSRPGDRPGGADPRRRERRRDRSAATTRRSCAPRASTSSRSTGVGALNAQTLAGYQVVRARAQTALTAAPGLRARRLGRTAAAT